MVFSERLTELLGASRGGATRLSEAMGVSKSTVSDWKNGRKEPSMENIVALANYFIVTTDYLLCMSTANEKKPSPGLSRRGQELLGYFEQLGEYEQGIILGEARGLLLAAGGVGEKATG